jgi:hypothetical protein
MRSTTLKDKTDAEGWARVAGIHLPAKFKINQDDLIIFYGSIASSAGGYIPYLFYGQMNANFFDQLQTKQFVDSNSFVRNPVSTSGALINRGWEKLTDEQISAALEAFSSNLCDQFDGIPA